MLNYKQIWHGIKPIRWLNKFNLTDFVIFLVKKKEGRPNVVCFLSLSLYLNNWEEIPRKIYNTIANGA